MAVFRIIDTLNDVVFFVQNLHQSSWPWGGEHREHIFLKNIPELKNCMARSFNMSVTVGVVKTLLEILPTFKCDAYR